MRITNKTISRNYNRSLNTNLYRLNKANARVASGNRFDTMAENTSLGIRALRVRHSLDQIGTHIDNAKSVEGIWDAAEKSLMRINEINRTVREKYESALNGDKGTDEHDAIFSEIDSLQQELLSLLNTKFDDRYIFGGSNVKERPFQLLDDGSGNKELYYFYGGAKYDDSVIPIVNTAVKVSDLTDPNMSTALGDTAFIDIGIGIEFDASGKVVSNSVFDRALVGLKITGTGENNLYNMIDRIKADIKNGAKGEDGTNNNLLDTFINTSNDTGLVLAKMGAGEKQLEFMISRLETNELVLKERQNTIEKRSPAEAITEFEMQQFIYNAVLQMGQRVLQPSLFSYLN